MCYLFVKILTNKKDCQINFLKQNMYMNLIENKYHCTRHFAALNYVSMYNLICVKNKW